MSCLNLTLFLCVALISVSSTWSMDIFKKALHNLQGSEDAEQLQKALQDYASNPSYKFTFKKTVADQGESHTSRLGSVPTCASTWSCDDCNSWKLCWSFWWGTYTGVFQCPFWAPYCNSTSSRAWCQQDSDAGCTGGG